VAVDNIAERLAHNGEKIIKIGHPARVAEQVLPHNLDVILQDQIKVVKDTEAKIRNMRNKLEKAMSCSKHKDAYWSSGRNEKHDEAIKHPEKETQ
jgi:hypothetical protein